MTYSIEVGQLIQALTGAAVVIVGLIAWFIRLEAKVKAHGDTIKEIKAEHHESHGAVWDKLNSISDALSRILQSIARMEGRNQAKES